MQRVGKQAAAVVDLAAFGGLLAKFASVICVLSINARFGPVDTGIRVQPVIVRSKRRSVAHHAGSLNGWSSGCWHPPRWFAGF
jgi:hypothetical protein